MVFEYNRRTCLPSSEELPDSDDTPVDNELQDLLLAERLRSLGIDPNTVQLAFLDPPNPP